MKRVLAQILILLCFSSSAFASHQCFIRVLVDTPACWAPLNAGYMPVSKKGQIITGASEFYWSAGTEEHAAKVLANQSPGASEKDYGCIRVSHGFGYPNYVYYDGTPTRAVELSENCYINYEEKYKVSNQKESIFYRIQLNPSVATDADMREERVEKILIDRGFWREAPQLAEVYVHHPSSSCAQLVRELLEGNNAAVNGLNEHEITTYDTRVSLEEANSCPSMTKNARSIGSKMRSPSTK